MTDSLADIPTLPNPEIHHEHRDVSGGWLRPTVFGMMDGLVSNFALDRRRGRRASTSTTGVALAGWAGLVGGAFSMATGEYVSVQSQNESTAGRARGRAARAAHNAAGRAGRAGRRCTSRAASTRTWPRGGPPAVPRPRPGPAHPRPGGARRRPEPAAQPVDGGVARRLLAFSVGAFMPLLPYLLGRDVAVDLGRPGRWSRCSRPGSGASGSPAATGSTPGCAQLVLGVLAAAVTYGVGSLFHAAVG